MTNDSACLVGLKPFQRSVSTLAVSFAASATIFSCGSQSNSELLHSSSIQLVSHTCQAVKLKDQEIVDGIGKSTVTLKCNVTSNTGADYTKLLKAFVDQGLAQGEVIEPAAPIVSGNQTGQQFKTKVISKSLSGELTRVQIVKVLTDGSALLSSSANSVSVTGTGIAGRVKSVKSKIELSGGSKGTSFTLVVKNTLEAAKPPIVGDQTFLALLLKNQSAEVEEGAAKLLNEVIVPNMAP
jgi:hypothetical protein